MPSISMKKAARYQLPPSVKYEIFPKSPCQPADFVSNCKLDQALHVYNLSKHNNAMVCHIALALIFA